MERIVGNCFAFLVLFFSCSMAAEITLRITDEDGAQLQSAGVGRPFLLRVEFKDFTGPQREPAIEGLNRYENYRTGVQMSTVNGKSSATYTYRCRIDSLGMHTIGPVTIPGTQERSAPLRIQVLNEQRYVQQQKKEDGVVFFRLTAEPESAVVGQKVILRARFYSTDWRMKLQNITMPNFTVFRVVDKVGPAYGKEKVNGADYEYTEWCIELYAQDPGNHLIPAFCADYEYPSTARYSGFMWGHFAQTKRAYSNSIRVNVESVPTGSKPADFIGNKVTVSASANPMQAKIGEGIIYTITFAGEGDLDLFKTPVLQGVPDAIKYYDSKTAAIGGTANQPPKKQCEYILQGMKEGSWEIPAQHFEIFDVDKRAYKTVSTKPVMISIVGAPSAPSEKPETDKEDGSEHVAQLSDGEIRPLHQNDPWYPTPERAPLNWSLFFMLVFAPCAYGLFEVGKKKFKRTVSPEKRAKRAAECARVALVASEKERNLAKIYPIFNAYFADVFDVPSAQLSSEYIAQKLRDAGAPDELVSEWDAFFARMSACAFGCNVGLPDLKIGADAIAWIGKLKEIL